MRTKVEIKGIREGLLATLGEGTWPEARAVLLEQVRSRSEFFRGARMALDVGNQPLHAVELSYLRDLLSEQGITLWAVLSNSPLTEQTAQTLGMEIRLAKVRPEPEEKPAATTFYEGGEAILVRRTLRSGFSLQHPGSVIVIGDVNAGAEVIAGGDVVVWGRLRGVVHAGAEGDENAVVCALDLSPTQIRIAGQVSMAAQRKGKPQPEMARLKDGRVVAEIWKT